MKSDIKSEAPPLVGRNAKKKSKLTDRKKGWWEVVV